jgi:hypothetical protein
VPQTLLALLSEMADYLESKGPIYSEFVGEMMHFRTDAGDETIRPALPYQTFLRFMSDGVARGEVTQRPARSSHRRCRSHAEFRRSTCQR